VTSGPPGGPRSYRVELAPAAQRQLDRLPPGDAAALRGPILALGREPRPPGVAKLRGTSFWRLRVGGLRVVYTIEDGERLVVVLRVARRSESTYRNIR
jgi:mRNA interferase RelE/StbE